MADITNTLLISMYDGIGENITPTANFAPMSGDFSLSNLGNSQLHSVTRTSDLTADRQITLDLGSPVEFNVFMIAGANASLDATGRFRVADDDAFSSGVVESGSILSPIFDTSLVSIANMPAYVPPWGRNIIYIHPTSITKRYIRWHQSDPSNSDGFMQWAILRVGLALQFETGFGQWKAIPKPEGPIGSQRILRGHELTLHSLTKGEAYTLQDLYMTSLATRRMLVIPEPLAPNTWLRDAIWCVLSPEDSYIREPVAGTSYSGKRYKVVLTFREVSQ